MKLYEIIKTLQEKEDKLEYLKLHKNNDMLKNYLKAVYDLSINYHVDKVQRELGWNLDWMDIIEKEDGEFESDFNYVLESLREIISDERGWVSERIDDLNASISDEAKELLNLLLGRSIGEGITKELVLQVFPDLF